MRPLPVQAITGVPPFVRGVAIVRGEPAPVVDLSRLVGGDESDPQRFVTITVGRRRLVLSVESVVGIRDIPAAARQSLPPLLRDASGDTIESLGTMDVELLVVLKSARLLPDSIWAALDRGGA